MSALILLVSLAVFATLSYAALCQNPIHGMRFVPRDGLPDDYAWELLEGPDFDVYRAHHPNNEVSGAGIYLGYFPDFPNADDRPCENGQVLGKTVSWVVLDGSETGHAFYRTALLEYQHSVYAPVYVHIWVYAEEESELQSLLSSLETLHFKPMISVFQLLVWRYNR